MNQVIFVGFCVVFMTAINAAPQSRIVGGVKADKGEWPWQLALWHEGRFMCGASIVASTWAVSAAHCVGDLPSQYQILAGTNINNIKCQPSECVTRTLVNATRHPDYKPIGLIGFPNDISFLSWQQPIKEESTAGISVKYITRTTKNDQVGKNCYVTGWGRLVGNGPLPQDLYETKIDVISNEDCQKIWGASKIHETNVCVYDLKDKDSGSCNGDSGGPLVCEVSPKKWELVGATSWGYMGCNTSFPSVYTRVSSFNGWLDSQAKPNY